MRGLVSIFLLYILFIVTNAIAEDLRPLDEIVENENTIPIETYQPLEIDKWPHIAVNPPEGIPDQKGSIIRGMFVNDTFFNGADRWRTGSYQRGWYQVHNSLPQSEFRLRLELIAPENLENPEVGKDRPYAAILELGYFKHMHSNAHHFSIGVKAALIGDSNQLENIHNIIHDLANWPVPNVDHYKINNHVSIGSEASWYYDIRTKHARFLPFAEAEIGARDRVTVGGDIIIGQTPFNVLSREQTTGQLMIMPTKLYSDKETWQSNLIMGADMSYVMDDFSLDYNVSNVENEPYRYRARVGVAFRKHNFMFYIGTTYLSPEFKGQGEGQFLQAFSVELIF